MVYLIFRTVCLLFFFFKQKTAYEMRISDWSSDVCSSDLVGLFREHYGIPLVHVNAETLFLSGLKGETDPEKKRKFIGKTFIDVFEAEAKKIGRSEERRVGKECVSTCRSRWSPYH